MSNVDNRERAPITRLVFRSALLAAVSDTITHGEYWYALAAQAVAGIVICLVLFALEKAALWPFRKRPRNVKPLYVAAYRGALLLFMMSAVKSGDIALALGASVGGALFAMLLFAIEHWVIKLLSRKASTSASEEGAPER